MKSIAGYLSSRSGRAFARPTWVWGLAVLAACGVFVASCEKEASPPPPPTPNPQGPNYAFNVELYRPHLELKSETAVPDIKPDDKILRPFLIVELKNKGPLAVNHLKFVARVAVPDINYSTEQMIEPFAVPENQGKVLPAGDGVLKFQVPMEPRKVDNPQMVMDMLKKGKSNYTVALAEIGFAPIPRPLTPAEKVALYKPHVQMEARLLPPEIKDGEIAPVLQVGLANLGPLNIAHLNFAAAVKIGDFFADQATITPFAVPENRGKVLPGRGGQFVFQVQFNKKKVADVEKAKDALKDPKNSQFTLTLNEIDFAG